MEIEFLRQSDKCGNVRNDDILNLHLGSGLILFFFFTSTSTYIYDGFAKGGSLTPLFLTTSYSDCFDFTLSKVGDGCIDGTEFLFKILLNLTSLDTATTSGIR